MTDEKIFDGADDRRSMPRYPSRAAARIIRETDAMRTGIAGRLVDVSVAGLGIQCEAPLNLGEEVRVELSNPTQRYKKEVRGVVIYSNAVGEKAFQVGVELHTRLTPPDVQQLRSNRPENPSEDTPKWV